MSILAAFAVAALEPVAGRWRGGIREFHKKFKLALDSML